MIEKNFAYWAEMKWPELQTADSRKSILIIPVGSVEQHGPHLPLLTDTLIPQEIIKRLTGRIKANLIMGIPISITYAPESEIYPGTISLSGATLSLFVRDMLVSYMRHPFSLVVLLNGHMESYQFILEGMRLAAQQDLQSQTVMLINWWDLVSEQTIKMVLKDDWPGWEAEHAARVETSMALYLFPDLVNREHIPHQERFVRGPFRIYPLDPEDKPASGSFANAQGSSDDIGEEIVEEIIQRLASIIEGNPLSRKTQRE
jgi:creatinine amidohydrolase